MVCDNCVQENHALYIGPNVVLNYTTDKPDKVLECSINKVKFVGEYVRCRHCQEPSVIFDAYRDENGQDILINGAEFCLYEVPQLDVDNNDDFYTAVFTNPELLAIGNVVLEFLGGKPSE